MNTIARSFTRVSVTAAFLVAALLSAATPIAARSDDAPRGIGLAGLGTQTAAGSNWGRLVLRDGVLTFNSSTTEWQLAVAEIKRASIGQADQLVVESMAGDLHHVTILDARMMADSPRDALKIIQRALRAPAARREGPIASAQSRRNRTENR